MKIDWQSKLASLPRGLTIREVAGRVGVSYFITRLAILKHKYPTVDARHFAKKSCRRLKLEKVDWSKSNITIARAFKVSRERVRVIRKQLGKPFVESRGRKLKYFKPGPPDKHPLRFEFPAKKLAKPFVDKPRKNPEIDCIVNMRDLHGPWTFKTNFTASKPKTKNQNDSKTKVPVVLRR